MVRSNKENEDENLVSGNAKSEKTGEERGIPLHDELVALGFLDFVNKTQTDQLFPYTFKKGYGDPLGFEISEPSYRNNFTWKELLNKSGVKPWAGKIQNGLE